MATVNISYSVPRLVGHVNVDLENFRTNEFQTENQLVRAALIDLLTAHIPVLDVEVSK